MRRDRRLRDSVALTAGAAAGRDVVGEPGDVGLEVVEPQQQRVRPALLDIRPPLPPMHEEPEVAGDRILLSPESEQLDLQLPLIQRRLRPPAERLQLAVQTVNDLRHVRSPP
jgi:hypothetical protein